MLSRRLTRCGYSVRVQTLILRAKRDKDTVSGRLNKDKNTVSKEWRGGGERKQTEIRLLCQEKSTEILCQGGGKDKDIVSGRPTEIIILCQGGRQR